METRHIYIYARQISFFLKSKHIFYFIIAIGAIYVVDELDYETQQSYELIVRATDSVSGISAEVPVLVSIEDVNDCPPDIKINGGKDS